MTIGTISDFHRVLKDADLSYSALSHNGVDLIGDHKSIDAAVKAFHNAALVEDLKTQIRHWREECGKLHARLSAFSPQESRQP